MGRDTLEYYYAAADRSMSMSWHISDSLLILLLVLAADAVSGAIAGLAAGDAGQDATLAASDPDRPSPGPPAVITWLPVSELLPPGRMPALATPAVRLAAPLASAGPAEPWVGSSWPACG